MTPELANALQELRTARGEERGELHRYAPKTLQAIERVLQLARAQSR